MKNRNFQKLYYHIRHRYLTTNNAVIAVALFIALSWAWGSVSVMGRNYKLQREIDTKNRQLKLVQLETDTLRYEQSYYKSDEYKELAVRQRLGLVSPGEKVLILPANTKTAREVDTQSSAAAAQPSTKPSNTQQWLNFLFGGRVEDLQN